MIHNSKVLICWRNTKNEKSQVKSRRCSKKSPKWKAYKSNIKYKRMVWLSNSKMSRFKVKRRQCSDLPERRRIVILNLIAATRRSARVPIPIIVAWAETSSKFRLDVVALSNFSTNKQNQLRYHLLEKSIYWIKTISKE